MTFPALITPLGGIPNNDLPGGGFGGRPDNSLPGGRPGRPDQGLPPYVGTWPPRPTPWPPIPPIVIEPDDDIGISLPIYLPGSPDNSLPPVPVEPVRPANPIVLPEPPGDGPVVGVIIPLPKAPKSPDGTQPALLWYGPGTIPSVVYLPPPATPK